MFATRVNRLLISAFAAVFILVGCKGHGSSSSIPQALTNWTWESGSQTAGSVGYYDTTVKGTATTTAQPGARSAAMSWKDTSGQFWVFSGAGGVNDMWKFNTTTLQWAWISGNTSTSSSVAGTYPATPNSPTSAIYIPGQRNLGATWIDGAGNLWMFGGYGTDSNGVTGYMNDLWSFNPSTTWWTWVGGSNGAGSLAGAPNWGTLGVAASSNQPNPRSSTGTWTDASGNFYMFGGQGYLTGTTVMQNDLWQYNPTANLWTWVGGSQSPNVTGVYGTLGVTAATNMPGARHSTTTWTSQGVFWMFGGIGVDSTGAMGELNDLWKYDPIANMWTWVNGSNLINALGVYGTNNVVAATNQPGARYGATGWVDGSSNFWLFGGYGINATGTPVILNDLWEYQNSSKQWVWYNGSYNGNSAGYYGTLSTLSSSNMPGSRYYAARWIDASGNFWMYGGDGLDAASSSGHLGDVWKFVP